VHYSRNDFFVTLGVNSPTGTERILSINMSPEAAKTLFRILEINVELYEKEHRKIGEPTLIRGTKRKKRKIAQKPPIYH
jgi:hypothetical protein